MNTLTRLAVLGLFGSSTAVFAQTAVYGSFSAGVFTNLVSRRVLYGGTAGFDFGVTERKRINLDFDIRGIYVDGDARYVSAGIGPRVRVGVSKAQIYGEFLPGFARFQDSAGIGATPSTDAQISVITGVDYRLSKRLAARVEYNYQQFYGIGGQFNPKTFSSGLVFLLK